MSQYPRYRLTLDEFQHLAVRDNWFGRIIWRSIYFSAMNFDNNWMPWYPVGWQKY